MFSHLPVKRLSGSLRLPVVFYRSPMFPMPFLPVGVRRFSVDLESRFDDLTKEVKTLRDEMTEMKSFSEHWSGRDLQHTAGEVLKWSLGMR
jgi:hypothetical protein